MRILLAGLLALSLTAAAQVPLPQVPVTGTLGPGGPFPLQNSGTLSFTSDADHPMVYPETSANFLLLTSAVALTAQRKLVAPIAKGFTFTIENLTTGGQNIQIIGSSGSGVVIPNGRTVSVYCDGTNYVSTSGVSSFTASALSWPVWLAPSVSCVNGACSLGVTASSIPNGALASSSTTVNGQDCPLGGSCTIPGTSLGGTLSTANVSPDAGVSITTISGLDGSHEIVFSTSGTIAGGQDLFTVTFTASRGHQANCVYSFSAGGSIASLTNLGQLPTIAGVGSTAYTLTAGPNGLPAGAWYINVSCP